MADEQKHNFGSRSSFRPLLREAREAREVVKRHIVHQERLGWGAYRTSLTECLDTLETKLPGTRERVLKKMEDKKKRGEPVVVFDYAGPMNARPEGATHMISTTLPKLREREEGREPWNTFVKTEPSPGHIVFKGNALLQRAPHELKIELQNAGPISFAFILPGAAAEQHSLNPFTRRKVSEMLKEIFVALAPDGEIYLDLAFLSETLTDEHIQKTLGACVIESSRLKNTFRITRPEANEL